MKNKISIIAIIIIVLILNGCSSQKYTLEEYNKIDNNISYSDVIGILGVGEELSSTTIEGNSAKVYSWKNSDGSNIIVEVENDKVVSKAQSGLKNGKTSHNIDNAKNTTADLDSKPMIVKSLPVEKTINGVTTKISKVIQDSDSLKIYITYTNKTNNKIVAGDATSKVIANNNEYDYDPKFNLDRTDISSNSTIVDIVNTNETISSVMFFKPIGNIQYINLEISPNYETFKFNNIKVLKQ
jgi:hypothetical protein